jgi:hypothetical protein
LNNKNLAFKLAGGGTGQGGLADPRLAEQAGVERCVVIRNKNQGNS